MGKFIKIKETRYVKSIIKKHKPLNQKSIVLYFNSSRFKAECETINFASKQKRDEKLNELDLHYISD
jgi:hypothetical protein